MENLDNNAGKALMQRWYEAPFQKNNTTEKIKLYNDTMDAVAKEDIQELSRGILGEIKAHKSKETDQLILWLAENTSYDNGEYQGAYEVLHSLFEKIIGTESEKQSISIIENQAEEKIKELNSKDSFTPLIPEIKDKILGNVGFHDLKATRVTSEKNKEHIEKNKLEILIQQINSGNTSLYELGFRKLDDFIEYFGAHCAKIEYLDLASIRNIGDGDLQKIAKNFPRLRGLTLLNSVITNDSAAIFQKMTHLTNLCIEESKQINDFSFLASLTNLTSLSLSYSNQCRNISFLQSLPHLQSLNLQACGLINDFDIIGTLTKLTDLNIASTNISDISFLNSESLSKNLTSLDIGNNDYIEDFTPINSLVNLKNLSVRSCLIKDLNDLNSLTSLTSLDVSFCRHIEDFSDLKIFTKLKALEVMRDLKSKDFSFFSSFPNLTSLDLTWCDKIEDFSFLMLLPNLTDLRMKGCKKIKDPSVLDFLKSHKVEVLTSY